MIRKYSETEIPRLLEIWEAAALIAHPFLSNDFHEMVKKAMKDMYLPNSDTWVYEESENIIGFIDICYRRYFLITLLLRDNKNYRM